MGEALLSMYIHLVRVHVKTCTYSVWCLVPLVVSLPAGLLLHTELMVSLFIRCTMRCEILPAELKTAVERSV